MDKKRVAALAATIGLAVLAFGYTTVAGAQMGTTMGMVAAKGAASIAANDQLGARDSITIARVVAPKDSWVVVHQDDGGMPGKRLGAVRVKAGESRDVVVPLDSGAKLTPSVLVALHVDRGRAGEFEFDMNRMAESADKPYYVGGKEVATAVKIADFGIPVPMGAAAIEAGDQPGGTTLTIAKVVAPEPSFVVVHTDVNGMPGKRVGYAAVPAGESDNVAVTLDKPIAKGKLLAAVHADRGTPGVLDFDMMDKLNSPDQPFMADGMEVATAFSVGPFGVPADEATISVRPQVGASGTVTIDDVKAPTGAWVVIHKDAGGGTPGARVGLQYVPAGESTNVKVALTSDMLSGDLLAAVHADRGTPFQFDFDMMDKLESPDQPFFVDGKEVATAFAVRSFGVPDDTGQAAVQAGDQSVRNATVTVDRVFAPTPGWIVVHLDNDGMPGRRVGLVHVPAGETRNAVVQLDASVKLTDKLLVAVHADRGEAGVFEFDMMDKVNSPDQPFFVAGQEVATAIALR